MPSSPFQYAVLRVVPRVERGEFVNAGVVLYCQDKRFLEAAFHLDPGRLRALDPSLDPEVVGAHLRAAQRVCAGGPGAGSIGLLPPVQRFGWLTAPRSTVVQPGPVHTGMAEDPRAALERLLETMVRPPG